MDLNKREFLQILGAASVAGMNLDAWAEADPGTASAALYDVPAFGNVSFLHITDCHAQLLPVYFREPSVNIGVGSMNGRLPHLAGRHLLEFAGIQPGSALSHALTSVDHDRAARRFGKVGGFAHLASLVKRIRANRPGALLLDGGDTWQGSGTTLWTHGQDMVDAGKLLGVDVMTGHWEFTLGMDRVKQIVEKDLAGHIDFVAQNVKTTDFEDAVFQPYVLKTINGVPCAIIGQAFPYTPIANPRYFVADWTFGIQEENLQKMVEDVRGKGAKVVVLLSHNGMDVDLKMASRVTGIDVVFGGHTHDGMPVATVVSNKSGKTLVTNAGSNGKFLGVMDLDVRDGAVRDFRYRLLPVFADVLKPDAEMDALIRRVRAPYADKLSEKLGVAEGTLYRRGNFNGTGDQLILDAIMDVQGAEIGFSPGFRWGTTLLPGQALTREWLMDMTATTYSFATVSDLSGAQIKTILEDVCDNLFNPDPYYQQGGDMVRVGGLQYVCNPNAAMGRRITDMRLHGKPLDADKTYKVAGWAPVAAEARDAGLKPVWDLVETWLKDKKGVVKAKAPNVPRLQGVLPNPGFAGDAS